jgi:hypothetical protein
MLCSETQTQLEVPVLTVFKEEQLDLLEEVGRITSAQDHVHRITFTSNIVGASENLAFRC